MKTFTGSEINENTRGVVYLCEYDHTAHTIAVIKELQYTTPYAALEAYSNIPNPESQIASGETQEQFLAELSELHNKLKDPKWQKTLADYL